MKGNEKISFTAEAVAFMRASENSDRFSKYFLSESAKKKFNLNLSLYSVPYQEHEKRIYPIPFTHHLSIGHFQLNAVNVHSPTC